MSTFHFNVHDGISLPDPDGQILSGIEAARQMAVDYAGNLIRELGDDFWTGEGWWMEVTDDRGLVLFSLVFSASIAPGGSLPAGVQPLLPSQDGSG